MTAASRKPRFPHWLRGPLLVSTLLPIASLAQPPARVEVAQAVSASLEEKITLSGSLRSPRLSAVAAKVDGYVNAVMVESGDRVSADQIVVTLDDKIPRLELARLQAVLDEAETMLEDRRRRQREAEDLMDDNNFARSDYESRRAEVLARQAKMTQLRTDAAIQATRVERHKVLAPFEGVVTSKLVEVGQRVTGNTPLLRVARMDPVWAEVQVPERYLPRVRVGNPVRVRPGFDDSDWIESRVSAVVPVSTDGSRTFLVRSELTNSDWSLSPGMSLRLELSLAGQSGKDSVNVPVDAVTRQANGEDLLWVIEGSGEALVAQPRRVSLGRRDGDQVEVRGGAVSAGERVVTRGNENLQAGQSVTLTGAGER